jgi:hypothetical protein
MQRFVSEVFFFFTRYGVSERERERWFMEKEREDMECYMKVGGSL